MQQSANCEVRPADLELDLAALLADRAGAGVRSLRLSFKLAEGPSKYN